MLLVVVRPCCYIACCLCCQQCMMVVLKLEQVAQAQGRSMLRPTQPRTTTANWTRTTTTAATNSSSCGSAALTACEVLPCHAKQLPCSSSGTAAARRNSSSCYCRRGGTAHGMGEAFQVCAQPLEGLGRQRRGVSEGGSQEEAGEAGECWWPGSHLSNTSHTQSAPVLDCHRERRLAQIATTVPLRC